MAPLFNGTRPPGGGDGGGGGDPKKELQNWSSLIGIVTAITGNVLIALALNVQRYAHTRLHRQRIEMRERARQALRRALKSGDGGDEGDGHENGGGDGAGAGAGGGYGTLSHTAGRDASRSIRDLGEMDNGRHLGEDTRNGLHRDVDLGTDLDGSRESDPLARSFRSTGSDDEDRAGSSTNYLKSPYWWLGQVLITVGEMGNFLAYGFAPASIVSPLGVVALVSNCVIAPIFFKEVFRPRDLWGVVVAVGGAVTVVLSASSKETKLAPHDVWDAITTLEFEVYMGVTCTLIVLLMWASPRYGNRSILIDLGLVGLFGGYTALATKGVSSMLSSTLLGAFTTPVTYVLVFVLLATAVMQVRYVNKALQRFDSTQVIPIQFVTFTLSVIIGSAVLYRDFERSTAEQAVKFVGGCLLTFFGVFLITSGRPRQDDPDDDEGSLSDVEGVEETIGLSRQGGDGPRSAAPTTTADANEEARSRRSSRVGFIGPLGKPHPVLSDDGVPSLRMPPAKSGWLDGTLSPEPEAEEDVEGAPLLGNPWKGPPAARNSIGPRAFSADAVITQSEPASALASEPTTNPTTPLEHPSQTPLLLSATPPSLAALASPEQPVTPRLPTTLPPFASASASRPHAHHFQAPLFSPSPLSSTVSAVVGDTLLLRRSGVDGSGSPRARRRLSLRRSRPSLRSSLFVPYDEAEPLQSSSAGIYEPVTPTTPAVADGEDVEGDPTADSSADAAAGGLRGRARSLSNTLGGLFGSRIKRRRSVPEDEDEQHAGLLEGSERVWASADPRSNDNL